MAQGLFKLGITIEPRGAVLIFEKKQLRRVMRQAGAEVGAVARKKLRGSRNGRMYRGSGGSKDYRGYKAGHYRASSPSEAPAYVTGSLARSLKVIPFKSGEGVAVRFHMFYSLFLEAGAKGGIGSGNRYAVSIEPDGVKRRFRATFDDKIRGKSNKRGGVVGSRVLQARPFLTQALDERQESIGTRIRAAILDDIQFKRLRA